MNRTTPKNATADSWTAASSPRSVPVTSFNFTASHWDASRRARRTGLSGAMVVALVFLWLVWDGVSARSTASRAKTSIASTSARVKALEGEIKELTGGTDDLGELLAERRKTLNYVFSNDISEVAVMELVRGSLVSGVTVRTISVEQSALATATAEKAYPTIYAIKVTADAPSLEAPAAWQQALLALQGSKLVSPDVQFTVTSGTNVSITMTAGLVDEAVLTNRESVRVLTGEGQPE